MLSALVIAEVLTPTKNIDRIPASQQTVESLHQMSVRATLRPADGSEDLSQLPVIETPRTRIEALDVVGNLYEAGTTYYDLQHNGTAGRMAGVDQNGRVHVTWMKADSTFSSRHISYNWFNPGTGAFTFAGGVQIDSSLRSGYVSMAVHQQTGWVFPAYHELQLSDPNIHATAAMSGAIGASWFLSTQPDYLYDSLGSLSIIWPKVALGRDSIVHMVSTLANSPDGQLPFYYSRGVSEWSGGFGTGIQWQTVDTIDGQPSEFMLVDTELTEVSANIAASPYSDRVVMVWNRLLRDPLTGNPVPELSNIFVQISEDNGLNWSAPFNVTGFCEPDVNCPNEDWQACNGDTLRAWIDNSVLIDSYDDIHVAFTVVSYHYWNETGQPTQDTRFPRSAIWHWNSGTDEVSPIATGFGESSIPGGWTNAGSRHRAVCKPSLAEDTTSVGEVYCSYWRAMPDQWSASGYPMGDVYISKSTDFGATWSVGKNVTQTDGGQNAPAGSSLSERDPTLAEFVANSGGVHSVHLFYEMDHDAGTAILSEGTLTRNELYYQAVPVDSIPNSPTVSWLPLHVAPVTGACCYTSELNEPVCEQRLVCECVALGGEFQGVGTSTCAPENDQCPGFTIECLPFTASGNNCCAALDWEDCGISAKDIFFNFTPFATTTARLSLCDSPESWNTYMSIYIAGANGSCTDSFRVGCLDDGCVDSLHIDQLFTFEGGVTYYLVLSGYFPEDCGSYVLNVTDETDYSQPDTLLYDNEESVSAYTDSIWASVRFTAPGEFELHSAYAKTAFSGGDAVCNFFVYLAPPAIGGEVAEAHSCVPFSADWFDPAWVNAKIDSFVSIPAGTDFWVVAGPHSLGPVYTSGWKFLNASSSSGRSALSSTGLYGSYETSSTDFMLRVGGVLGLGSPDSLVIRRANNGEDVELRWSPAVNATEYDVYRSVSEDIQPVPENFLGTTLATSFVDFGVLLDPEAQYYYIVTATGGVSWLSGDMAIPTETSSAMFSRPMQFKIR